MNRLQRYSRWLTTREELPDADDASALLAAYWDDETSMQDNLGNIEYWVRRTRGRTEGENGPLL